MTPRLDKTKSSGSLTRFHRLLNAVRSSHNVVSKHVTQSLRIFEKLHDLIRFKLKDEA